MSLDILDDVLKEEYERAQRMKKAMSIELASLPAGYISKKKINNKTYYYLQRRDGQKLKGTYLSSDQLQLVLNKIARRKQLEASLKELTARIQKIERFQGKDK